MNPRGDQDLEIQILYLRPEEFQYLAGRGRPGFIIDYDQQDRQPSKKFVRLSESGEGAKADRSPAPQSSTGGSGGKSQPPQFVSGT